MSSTVAPACVVFNPNAGSAERIELLREAVEANGAVELCSTDAPGDAGKLAAGAVRDGRRVLIAAGGDGTVSEVVAGLMDARQHDPDAPMPALLVVPMGTGNDLCRTFDLPEEPAEALALLDTGRRVPLDVMRYTLEPADGGETKKGWCVNVAAGGFAAKLKQVLTHDLKKRWGPLAYARAAIGSASELDPHDLTFQVDEHPPQRLDAVNVIVANARFAGGGIEVAPEADPGDGLMEFVVILPGDWMERVDIVANLLAGNLHESGHVIRIPCRRLVLDATPAMPFNIDGDPVGEGKFTLEIIASPLEIIVPA